MMPKRKAAPSSFSTEPAKKTRTKSSISGRDGLGTYVQDPTKHDASRVISYDDSFVTIHDLYPKSSVHTLILPRSGKHQLLHPFDAFEDTDFLASVQEKVTEILSLVAKELRRRYGTFSKQDAEREAILNGEIELAHGEELPLGRNWEKEVRAGVHAHPSMNHLHVHVISVDRCSEFLKHRKHYNSFTTPFFVPIEDFPLAKDDRRRDPRREAYLDKDMICWKCGKNFGNRFARLKEHLAEEFEEWKKQ